MFDPDGDQAAADSTRSSTSLDTGWSLNPRTARRLVTASYTSIIASLPPAICFVQTHASSSSAKLIKSQYSQGPGTQRKTSPSTATWQTDGNDRRVATSDSRFAASSRRRRTQGCGVCFLLRGRIDSTLGAKIKPPSRRLNTAGITYTSSSRTMLE